MCRAIILTFLLAIALTICPFAAFAGPLPDTGQTKCYDSTQEIPCPQPGEPFFGQDGNYTINPPSYTKLDAIGNYLPDDAVEWMMVRDNVTGLIWEVKTDDESIHDDYTYNWQDSQDVLVAESNNQKFGGYQNWRLPSVKELSSLVNRQNFEPAIETAYFPKTPQLCGYSNYWSSDILPSAGGVAWNVLFCGGSSSYQNMGDKYHTRIVRDGLPESSTTTYVVNGDGTVTDKSTGLMWQQQNGQADSWDSVLEYCQNLSIAGYDDWRLPNINELLSIVDYTQKVPSIDNTAFPGTGPYVYWSSTTTAHAGGSGNAWIVSFDYGSVNYVSKSFNHYVRAVRGGQVRAPDRLVVNTPTQASRWDIGATQTLSWDAAGVMGNVKVSLSREGGKVGTFETIAENTPNNGSYEWTVTGPESFNCALRIEPVDEPSKGTTQNLFTIAEIRNARISAKRFNSIEKYQLTLTGRYTDGFLPLFALWALSDSAIATLNNDMLESLQNGHIYITANYEGESYSKTLFVYKDLDELEHEPNNTVYTATLMVDGSFYKGHFYSGDIDYYEISLPSDSALDIGYLSQSFTADMLVELYDSAGNLMASGRSMDGESLMFPLGLAAGDYYLKVTAAGDIDQVNDYIVVYKTLESMHEKTVQPITLGAPVQDVIYNLEDQSEYTFTLAQEQAVKLTFKSTSGNAKYRIELLDGGLSVVDSVLALGGLPVNIEAVFPAGEYTIRITPVDDIDAGNPYVLDLVESTSQLELENNDTYQTATPLDLAQPIIGRFATDADSDFFVFDLNAPQYLQLDLSAPNSNGSFVIGVYKDSSDNLINGIATVNGRPVTLHMGLGVGKYFIKVSSTPGQVDTVNYYSLSVTDSSQTNFEIESNNTLKFANALEKASAKTGVVYAADDKDYFGFYLPTADIFYVTLMPSSTTADYKISLVDENDQLFEMWTSDDGFTYTLGVYKQPGNYFIRVESNGDIDQYKPYSLAVSTDAAIVGVKQLVGISVAGATNDMNVTDTQTLEATASYSDVTSEVVASPIWTSLDPSVATIDASGLVTGIGEGSTTIIATHGGVSGRYDVTVGAPTVTYAQHYGNLVLVAGGGVDATNTLKESTQYLSDLVYGRFRGRLFQNEDIFYINPMTWHDVDGDGYDDNIVDDSSPTVAEFGAAVTTWAANQSTDGPLYVYLIDHGGIDKFSLFPGQTLTAVQLAAYLDAFQAATGRKVVVVIEACKSGSFTDDLTAGATDRVVVTSTDNLNAYLDLDGRISFSQFLVDSLYAGDSFQNAFNKAGQKLTKMGLPYNQMVPQLVEAPMTLAGNTYVGGSFAIAGLYPEIIETSASQTVAAGGAHGFYAVLSDLEGIDRVWAVVIPPDYVPPETSADLSAPQVTLPSFDLTDPDGDGRFDGTYSGFTFSDVYKITFYASNANGNVGISPASIDVTVTGGAGLDTDGDGMPNDWEDQYAGLDSNADDAAADPDGDTLSNFQEYQKSTSPINADTDGDGMNDGWEVAWGFNPNLNDASADADGDGVTNIVEYADGTNPINGSDYLDHVPPQVTLTAPVDGEVNVARGVSLVMTFSEAMNTGTLSAGQVSVLGSVTGTHVGSITYDAVNHKLTLLPATVFDYGEMVSVTLSSAVTDVAGNTLDGDRDGIAEGSPMDDYVWNFTIEESPLVSPPNPYDANADWKIGDFELLDAIDAWAVGSMATLIGPSCDVDFYLLDVIDLWKAPGYLYDVGAGDACFKWKVQ